MTRDELSRVGEAAVQVANADVNPGWLLAYGLKQPDKKLDVKAELIDHAAQASKPSPVYREAYKRWRETVRDECRFAFWEGRLENRLLIGMAATGPLETNITLSRPYGMPLIPGSALKGIARALARGNVKCDVLDIVFGREGNRDEDPESGYLVFHDAWWIPEWIPDRKTTHALVPEVVTPHHPKYYQGYSVEATDFDSPIPVPQIAAHGDFLFVVEGVTAWAQYGLAILRDALKDQGIGAAGSAGYGYFVDAAP